MIKLMIVDDEAIIREGIRQSIDWGGFGVRVTGAASNGAQALELCKTSMPDIMIVDIRMPVMDGLELSERLHESAPAVKIIILTGHEEFEYAQKAIEYRVYAYILKPVGAEELVSTVLKLRDEIYDERRRAAAESAECPPNKNSVLKGVVKCAVEYVAEHYELPLNLKRVARAIHVSPNHLSRVFKQDTGMNFLEWLNTYRLEKVLQYLSDPELKTYEIAQKTGFQNYKHFSNNFKRYFGCSVTEYKNAARL